MGTPSQCAQTCGDGLRAVGEFCDDGNLLSGDGCSLNCEVETGWNCLTQNLWPTYCHPICNDGLKFDPEQCDNGPRTDPDIPDGCSDTCVVETGWSCVGVDGDPSSCAPTETFCGNGVYEFAKGEACDDGNSFDGDGCSSTCQQETGFTCDTTVTPTTCNQCGNSIINTGETCDDGNQFSGDGCSGICIVENGYICVGTPSTCIRTCGDGVIQAAE